MAEPRLTPDPSFGGLLVVDKPAGWTSHDVVARCRKRFGLKKVGHAGTLDPDATGVLLVGLGSVTRLLRFLSGLPKSYRGEVVLGVATSTLDASGEVTGRWPMGAVTLDEARAAAATLTGQTTQVPPMVSAVHVGGRRLHELARAGIEVEREARPVTVTRFLLAGPVAGVSEDGSGPVFSAVVECSSGTYVRALAADLGALLGGGAHLRNLRRTRVGPYTLADAVALDDVSPAALRPPRDALPGMAVATVDGPLAAAVGHGAVLSPADLGSSGEGPWAVVASDGRLLAVYEGTRDGRAKPSVVLPAPPAGPAPGSGRPAPVRGELADSARAADGGPERAEPGCAGDRGEPGPAGPVGRSALGPR